jgi:hypothetical protein
MPMALTPLACKCVVVGQWESAPALAHCHVGQATGRSQSQDPFEMMAIARGIFVLLVAGWGSAGWLLCTLQTPASK